MQVGIRRKRRSKTPLVTVLLLTLLVVLLKATGAVGAIPNQSDVACPINQGCVYAVGSSFARTQVQQNGQNSRSCKLYTTLTGPQSNRTIGASITTVIEYSSDGHSWSQFFRFTSRKDLRNKKRGQFSLSSGTKSGSCKLYAGKQWRWRLRVAYRTKDISNTVKPSGTFNNT
jgi:hypothetical protein